MALNPLSEITMLDRETAMRFSGSWWVILLNGILSVVAGILVLTIPWTLQTIAFFIGAVLVLRGILKAFSPPTTSNSRGWNITVGIIEALVGAAIIVFPSFAAFTLLTLAFFVGIWFVVWGIATVTGSIANRTTTPYWWLGLTGGILATALGIFALYRPILTLTALIAIIGIWAIVVGTVEIGLSFEVRHLPQTIERMETARRREAA